jgi:hypothetical protein
VLVLQAMRQDLTVQHLRNELAVRIYQAHARAALEYGDSAEYNQCQTQLNVLAVEVSCPSTVHHMQRTTPLTTSNPLMVHPRGRLIIQHMRLTSGCWSSAGRPRCGVPRVSGISAAVPDRAR